MRCPFRIPKITNPGKEVTNPEKEVKIQTSKGFFNVWKRFLLFEDTFGWDFIKKLCPAAKRPSFEREIKAMAKLSEKKDQSRRLKRRTRWAERHLENILSGQLFK